MSSKTRLALWDYISRRQNLPASAKILLLVAANYTDPRTGRANLPISLFVRDGDVEESDVRRYIVRLETSNRLSKLILPGDDISRPPSTLFNLSPQLILSAQQWARNPE
ncbi:hypothetical protein [Leptolyngbya sp. FACHB-261]|uniref:hypothetical protein n=1 Tax=Leptolyngbya sp. FACHB-261 TaxID=2692806 RepID=UPI001681C89B|nr:hypothetical protein [Leptolyngbya sp. FACHB-261]MBD2104695.1 hypothetical protein [Leptolyngbya sp. FACHB-261]